MLRTTLYHVVGIFLCGLTGVRTKNILSPDKTIAGKIGLRPDLFQVFRSLTLSSKKPE
jgi:hypothetical protein